MGGERVRVLRVLEYEGTLEDVTRGLGLRAVVGTVTHGGVTIREAMTWPHSAYVEPRSRPRPEREEAREERGLVFAPDMNDGHRAWFSDAGRDERERHLREHGTVDYRGGSLGADQVHEDAHLNPDSEHDHATERTS